MEQWNPWRVTTTGNAEHGWLVDIHDGVNSAVYNPTGETLDDVEATAKAEHSGKYWPVAEIEQPAEPPAPPQPTELVVEPVPPPAPEPVPPPVEPPAPPAAS